MKTILIIAGVCLFIYIGYRIYRFVNLDKGLDARIANGAVILDVRTEREFSTGHIEGAVNIPLSRLHGDVIPLDKKRTYITVCSHGLRSVKAVSLLKERGFANVFNGGAWSDLSLPTVSETSGDGSHQNKSPFREERE
ncbi:rhodanese-like domain-containing protein [Filimonas effusa]|uniref:Rhodanese-like domain-containing protein n=1 Tax=Filimonas effusa TaxID=2508721 RepID=A0A4Q1DBT5_9BACT|nr:rhodanese-like domain-containing protein [Filimonas effusa]RXK86398.1 rhodanese-like domain-containing protein [Filimonas effusa]